MIIFKYTYAGTNAIKTRCIHTYIMYNMIIMQYILLLDNYEKTKKVDTKNEKTFFLRF